MSAAGLSRERVQRLLGFYRRVRAGWCAPVHPDVEAVLGLPARGFAPFAADYAGCWRAVAGILSAAAAASQEGNTS
jgi:hypothetical protein